MYSEERNNSAKSPPDRPHEVIGQPVHLDHSNSCHNKGELVWTRVFLPRKSCDIVMSDPTAPLEDVPTTSYLGLGKKQKADDFGIYVRTRLM